MAIQKVSDLPILRRTNKDEFDYNKVKSSLIELSYKISSDDSEGVSRYQSRAVTVAEFADYVLSAQTGGDVVDITLSGNVFLNKDDSEDIAQNYRVLAKTGDIDVTAFNRYELSSSEIKFNCGNFTVKTAGQTAFTASGNDMHIVSDTVFTGQVYAPTITDTTKKNAVVNLEYLASVIPTVESPFMLFETKYLDYDLSSRHWVNTATAGWLSADEISGFPNAFNHLRNDLTSDDGTDITISYAKSNMSFKARRAKDGHIVCHSNVSSNVDSLFSKTGVAWMYIVDPEGLRFRLPRNSNFIMGCKDAGDVGNYMPPTLPPHTHEITYNLHKCDCAESGGIKNSPHNQNTSTMSTGATTYNGLVQSGDTVSPPATKMYLYMYCS